MKTVFNRGVIAAMILLFAASACATLPRASEYVEPARLAALISEQTIPYLLLDVRTPAEFAGGHIPTAVNIPYDEVAGRIRSVGKDAMIIVYCASGYRASLAAQTLSRLGYTNVANFGAVSKWTGGLVREG